MDIACLEMQCRLLSRMESATAAGVKEGTLWELLSDELYDFCTASSEAQQPSTSTGSTLHHDKASSKNYYA